MFHPPVGMDQELSTSLGQKFAEDAFALITHFQMHKIELDEDGACVVGSYMATDRLDIEQADGQTIGVRLRLAEDLDDSEADIFTQAIKDNNFKFDSDELTFVAFEYCRFETTDEFPAESEIIWEPYVYLTLAPSLSKTVWVINGESGEQMTDLDLMQAMGVLSALRNYLNSDLLSESLIDDQYSEQSADEFGKKFDPGDFIGGNECPVCVTNFTHCNHLYNVGSLN